VPSVFMWRVGNELGMNEFWGCESVSRSVGLCSLSEYKPCEVNVNRPCCIVCDTAGMLAELSQWSRRYVGDSQTIYFSQAVSMDWAQ